MAWWDDVADAVSSAADTVAEVVETVATAAADTVADVVETAGNAVQDGANALGDVLSGVPLVGGLLDGALGWLGGIVAGATSLIGAMVKGWSGIFGGLVGGLIRIIGGILSLNGELILEGLIDIGSSIAGAILLVLGKSAALVQTMIFCQNPERPLTKAEKEMLRKVFHLSVSLYNIRVIEGWSGIFGITTDGAFTLGNTIYANSTDFTAEPEVLVHECVHVWQYQVKGPRYASDALGAQAIYGRDGSSDDAYSWRAELDRGRDKWLEFNKEAGAKLIDEIWSEGTMVPLPPELTDGNGTFYLAGESYYVVNNGIFAPGRQDYTKLAVASVETLRNGVNVRMSKFLSV